MGFCYSWLRVRLSRYSRQQVRQAPRLLRASHALA